MTPKELVQLAMEAMGRAYAPYSGYYVGAALLTEEGRVYTGCNIENAAFSPTCCAERTAFFSAIAQGERKFAAIAVVGGKGGKYLVSLEALESYLSGSKVVHMSEDTGEAANV